MRKVARRLVGRSYVASKQYALLRMRRRAGNATVVVFSMGKAGSTAIARAVEDATGARVFQVFRLDAERLAQAERRYRAQASAPFPGAAHLWESEYLLRHPPSGAAPWTVITPVREPIAQAVSAYFHGRGRSGAPSPAAGVDALRDDLLANDWVRAPVRWFDREFAPALGMDVYQTRFDPELGHGLIETPAARVLLVRQENLGAAPDALGAFLGRDGPVPIGVRNEATAKDYADRYREFVGAVRFPRAVLDEAYGSRYARHFYADSEIERFRRRWAE